MEKQEHLLNSKDLVMDQLKQGIKDVFDSENFKNWCLKTGRLFYNNYSLRNALLVMKQNEQSSYVMGYEAWKSVGRQVKQGAKGIKILTPVFAKEKSKGSLFISIKKIMNEQFKKDSNLELATYKLGQSSVTFNMTKNGLFEIKINDKVVQSKLSEDKLRKFIDNNILGKVPIYFGVATVFDVNDTTNEVEYLWLKSGFKKEELALDEKGNAIKNKRGEYKIINTDERKNKFDINLDIKIEEKDTDKMNMLYDVLKSISVKNSIPVNEKNKAEDEVLSDGALGYYHRKNNNIVIDESLGVTNKVSVMFHEMAHSRLHSDLEQFKEEMGNDIEVTKSLKEVQAEAVACITASNFGINTETHSFNYLASWSNGRELNELEKSLTLIWNESKSLMNDISKELKERGLNLSLEGIEMNMENNAETKKEFIKDNKKIVLGELDRTEELRKELINELYGVVNENQKTIISEQLALVKDANKKLVEVNKLLDLYENNNFTHREDEDIITNVTSELKKIEILDNRFENLKEERVNIFIENMENSKADLKEWFDLKPLEVLKEFEKLKDLSDNDLNYLATSKVVKNEFNGLVVIGLAEKQFEEYALKRLDQVKAVQSKKGSFVEINYCDQYVPNLKDKSLVSPNLANKTIRDTEKLIRGFKDRAEKEGEYYPCNRCNINLYTLDKNDNLLVARARIDIGDGTQKNLVDFIENAIDTNKDSIDSKGYIFAENFKEAVKERTTGKSLVTIIDYRREIEDEELIKETAKPMSDWENKVEEVKSNDNELNDFLNALDNSMKGITQDRESE